MSVRAQLNFPGIPQLVVQSAFQQDPCFYVPKDYQQYLNELEQAASEFNCDIHAFVLLPTQVCLLLTPHTNHGIEKLMQMLNQRYAAYISKTYDRTDRLWKSYEASVLEAETLLLPAMAFIEQMPDRQNLGTVDAYPWSSHQETRFITPHAVFNEHQQPYRELLSETLDATLEQNFKEAIGKETVMGSDAFKEKLAEQLAREKQKKSEACVSCVMVY